MKHNYTQEDWEYIVDTPEEFDDAIQNAESDNESKFFKTLMYKVVHEPAASNDVLMHNEDNEDGIYILRVSDDFMIGKKDENGMDACTPSEYSGLFFFLSTDMYPYLGHHITVGEWLKRRDYGGIRYDANNDER